MTTQPVGAIPEFTQDNAPAPEEVVEPTPVAEPTVPATEEGIEPPAVPPPANEPVPAEDPVLKQIEGLAKERDKLLDEVKTLRGTRREIKQDRVEAINKEIDALNDLNPQDVTAVERILRAKGYITKQESNQMFYEAVKQEELDKFLDKYPEYRQENDANDVNWNSLTRELGYYRMPEDPRKIGQVLERAHQHLASTAPKPNIVVQKRQIAVAGHGAGGTQKTSAPAPQGRLTQRQKDILLQGGWKEDEVKNY